MAPSGDGGVKDVTARFRRFGGETTETPSMQSLKRVTQTSSIKLKEGPERDKESMTA